MQVSEQWLRSWANPQNTSTELASQLTMAGFEVESIENVAEDFSGVVIAEVITCERHPDAEKLSVCQVSDGQETVNIVCGAKNVRAGLRVALAKIGAVLPGDFKIKKAKLRGVESCGMLCSLSELKLAEESEGIMELPNDAPIGTSLRDYLQLDDKSFVIKLTPNRGDCLSMAGIAREVAAINRFSINEPSIPSIKPTSDARMMAQVFESAHCPRYTGRLIQNVQNEDVTPLWLKETLRRSKVRSISPIVDVLNYVMLELGQPMHAFDADKIEGEVIVRLARDGEKLQLLDGRTISLSEKDLVIADDAHPLALAGIMGGLESAVTPQTRNIFIESAFFTPELLFGRALFHTANTDASYRFERGVDPQLCLKALDRATELILSICGGEPGPHGEIAFSETLPKRNPIRLRYDRLEQLLGCVIPAQEVEIILTGLGMKWTVQKDRAWSVTPPSFRFDLYQEEDLIEEVIRIHGYNNVPARPSKTFLAASEIKEATQPLARLRDFFADQGYHEIISYSFVDPQLIAQLYPQKTAYLLKNALSPEMSAMRNSMFYGLIKTAQYNLNRQQTSLRLFETGLCFDKEANEIRQYPMLGGLVCGQRWPAQWAEKGRSVDFFDVKGDIETWLYGLEDKTAFEFREGKDSAFHPGQSAEIYRHSVWIGRLGLLHPSLAQSLDLLPNTFLFEFDLNALMHRQVPKLKPISKFPTVKRDLALIVDASIPAQQIEALIREEARDWLVTLTLFDLYQGQGIENGKKSVALGLTLQHPSRTLLEDEVMHLMDKIVTRLQKDLGAILRE